MKIIVTGATGFIGRALCNELAKEHNVIALTRRPEKASVLAKGLEDKGFNIDSSRRVFEYIKKIFRTVQIVILLLGLLIVISVGIGTFNGLNLVVYSERDIIGVMRAVGAKRRDIMEIILLQAVWIGIAGGILGTAIVFLGASGLEGYITKVLQSSYDLKVGDLFSFSLPLIFGGLFFPSAACLIFGILPGLRAISLKPADVLK